MAEITRKLPVNSRGQFFFAIATTASTRCLFENFQLSCYLLRVNATTTVAVQVFHNDRMIGWLQW